MFRGAAHQDGSLSTHPVPSRMFSFRAFASSPGPLASSSPRLAPPAGLLRPRTSAAVAAPHKQLRSVYMLFHRLSFTVCLASCYNLNNVRLVRRMSVCGRARAAVPHGTPETDCSPQRCRFTTRRHETSAQK